MRRHLCRFVFCLICCPVLTCAGQAAAPPTNPTVDYSKEAYVDEEDLTKISYDNDGTNTRDASIRVRIQSEAGVERFGVLTFSYQNATETIEIDYVRVRKPDGSLVASPPDTIQDMAADVTRQAPFYTDMREKHVAVKGLSAGDVLEYHIRWHTNKPLAPGQFWYSFNFPHDYIILHEEVQISVPRGRALKWRSPALKPAITEDGGRRTFTWTTSQLERKSSDQEKQEQDETTYQTARGKLPPPDVMLSTFQSWNEVGAWYNSLQLDQVKPSDQIRAKAAELTNDATHDNAKLRAIYNYVSTQFRYIGVAFGIGRYQPHSAAEVLSNRYGDCKDKHTLFASLLAAAGIKTYPALINSFHELDADVPSPVQFDHVITAVPQGNGYVWLDTTAEVAPFGYLISVLRGKPALVIPAEGPATLVTTVANPPGKAVQSFKIDAKLKDDGTLEGKVERTMTNDDVEILLRKAFRRVPMPQWKDLVQQISYNSGFAGDVSEVSTGSPEKTDEPFHFSYTYYRRDYPQWSERRISSPLPPMLPLAPNTKPSHPILLGSVEDFQCESRVELPGSYSPQLPANVELKEDFAEYRVSYSVKGGVLETHRTLNVKLQEVPLSEYEAYKKFAQAVSDDRELYVALSPAGNSTMHNSLKLDSFQSAVASLPASDNSVAMRAFSDAVTDAQGGDVPGVIDSLNQAVKADPHFARAWIMLAGTYASTGKRDRAVEILRDAHEADPHDLTIVSAFVSGLMWQQLYEEAASVLQDVVKSEPPNSDLFSALGGALFVLKRYDEAADAVESAIKLAPDRANLYGQLGSIYTHGGKQDKALIACKKAVELDPSPAMFNDLGYDMADAGQNLPLALEFAQKAVRGEEEATAQIKLADLTEKDLATVSALAYFWDTLGWVYFRLGKVDEAEKYLRSAWISSQSPVNADHLGQVYERQNKKDQAVQMYRLALAASRTPGQMKDTEERLDRLGGSVGSLRFGNKASEELSKLRTIKLPKITSESVSAEFFLLFGPGSRVLEVKFVSGSEELKSADPVLRAAAFDMPFPDDGPTRLVRRGILSCSSVSECMFVLYTPDLVRSVN